MMYRFKSTAGPIFCHALMNYDPFIGIKIFCLSVTRAWEKQRVCVDIDTYSCDILTKNYNIAI